MSKITTVLFDFDGTLIDTNELILQSWQHTYRYYTGHDGDKKSIIDSYGEPLKVTLKRVFPDADQEEALTVYRTYQETVDTDYITLFPGMTELVKELKSRGLKLGIVTSRIRYSAEKYLKQFGIGEYFDDMCAFDDTRIHKPDPEPINVCLRKLGSTPEESIMIGDSLFDVKCANNAGTTSVLVGWRVTDKDSSRISDAIIDYEAETPEDILKIIENIR